MVLFYTQKAQDDKVANKSQKKVKTELIHNLSMPKCTLGDSIVLVSHNKSSFEHIFLLSICYMLSIQSFIKL